MDKMKRIVICKHCGEPEYFGEMRWLSRICSCRDCYKGQYEREEHEIYRWKDLDGKRPTMEEYIEQQKKRRTGYDADGRCVRLKAITVLQPWAWLLASGKKRCETRSWKTSYRGEILIHAGKKNMTDIMRQTLFEARYMKLAGAFRTEMVTGAIIGRAKLVNCVLIDEAIRDLIRKQHIEEYALGYFVLDHYAWVLEEPELFDRPIPATGKQGLWNFYGDL